MRQLGTRAGPEPNPRATVPPARPGLLGTFAAFTPLLAFSPLSRFMHRCTRTPHPHLPLSPLPPHPAPLLPRTDTLSHLTPTPHPLLSSCPPLPAHTLPHHLPEPSPAPDTSHQLHPVPTLHPPHTHVPSPLSYHLPEPSPGPDLPHLLPSTYPPSTHSPLPDHLLGPSPALTRPTCSALHARLSSVTPTHTPTPSQTPQPSHITFWNLLPLALPPLP